MPFRTIPTTDTRYGLISFDATGAERRDDPDGLMSQRLLDEASNATNIFLFSHGWMGDVPAAIDQYDRWIRAFDTLSADRERAASVFPGFKPMYIGLHWPSKPWGEEAFQDGSFAAGESEDLFEDIIGGLEDTPATRSALSAILEEAKGNVTAAGLSPRAREAFLELHRTLELDSAVDRDGQPFEPEELVSAPEDASFDGGGVFGGMLDLLRTCSYWTKKKLARKIGEGGIREFVQNLQRVAANRGTRVHLMGHSFGCIVISSILGGLERPVDSVALVQGALSLWSYSPAIPIEGAGPGYFHRTLTDAKIRGPLITTRSRYDTAVGRLYPLASRVSGSASFEPGQYPEFGAIGTFGLQGLPEQAQVQCSMLPADGEYGFECGKVYNLESSRFIAKGGGSSGAHNDIDGPEVAHAIWQAAFASA